MEKQPEGGKIAILECPTQNSVNDRITGFEETIANAENGFEVVARADTGGQFERALEETQEILKEFPDLTAIMCGNEQTDGSSRRKGELYEENRGETTAAWSKRRGREDQFLRGSAGREALQSSTVPGGRGEALPGISHGRGLRGSALSCAGGPG